MVDIRIYDQWNIVKKSLQKRDKLEFFKERQIWWCNVGQNLGFESYGKGPAFSRPVLVYKKLSREIFLGIPMTSKIKYGSWYQTIRHRGKLMTAQLNQIRVLDKKRLIQRMGQIDDEDYKKIKTGFTGLYLS